MRRGQREGETEGAWAARTEHVAQGACAMCGEPRPGCERVRRIGGVPRLQDAPRAVLPRVARLLVQLTARHAPQRQHEAPRHVRVTAALVLTARHALARRAQSARPGTRVRGGTRERIAEIEGRREQRGTLGQEAQRERLDLVADEHIGVSAPHKAHKRGEERGLVALALHGQRRERRGHRRLRLARGRECGAVDERERVIAAQSVAHVTRDDGHGVVLRVRQQRAAREHEQLHGEHGHVRDAVVRGLLRRHEGGLHGAHTAHSRSRSGTRRHVRSERGRRS